MSEKSWRFSPLLLCLLSLHAPTGAGLAQDTAPPPAARSLADFATLRDIKSVVATPDGKELAYTVGITDLAANRVRTELWLIGTSTREPRKLPVETDAIEKVLWSPQGGQLAVVGRRDAASPTEEAGTYLWLVDAATGTSRRLTRIERSNHYHAHQGANLCWSPDGAALAYVATDEKVRPAEDGPLVVTRIQYKTRTAFSDNRRSHVWIVEAATGKSRQLTTGPHDEHSIDWSSRGEIAFCSNRERDPDVSLHYDMYAVEVNKGTIRRLTRTSGNEMSPVWSPDGRQLAYTMTKRPHTTIDSVAEDDHVWVLDAETGVARELTAQLDRRCAQVRWSQDGKSVHFLARNRGKSLIYRVPASGGEATPLFDLAGMVSSYTLPAGPGPVACVLSTPTQPAEVWTVSSSGGEPKVRTRVNADVISRWKLVQPREVRAKSFDGTEVHGWVMLPPGATAERKAPVILYVHGGPHGMYGSSFSATFQLLCARGYAIVYLNPRGSNGYGQKFSDGSINDWGGGDYRDLMAGLDHALKTHPELDETRLGVTGGSYGGYMTNWIITQTDRFQAAVTYASLSNLISFYATSLYQDLMHIEFEGEPWDRYEILWERSPLKHIKKAKTPTLILHGEADNDVHITQGEELYTALKRLGVETVFVRYPREGHGASEPRFQLDQLQRTAEWFDRHLGRK